LVRPGPGSIPAACRRRAGAARPFQGLPPRANPGCRQAGGSRRLSRAPGRRRDPARRPVKVGRIARGFARSVVALRFLILPPWLAAAAAAVTYLPAFDTSSASGLGAIVPEHSVAVATEQRSLHEFDLPLLSRIAVVQRNPQGLPLLTQLRAVARAL